MFQGFNESTIMYYEAIRKENSKKIYQDNEQLYFEGVKFPLDELYFELFTPGGTVQYDIPIMKVQTYSLDDIFEKRLLMLIPFYIFSHEKSFPEYNSNEQKLEELKAEYQIILDRLDELERQEVIGAFDKRTIIELSGDVIKEIAQKYKNVQKGVGDMMSGALIETSARKIKTTAEIEKQKRIATRMLQDGELPIDKIAMYTELMVEEVEKLAGLLTV